MPRFERFPTHPDLQKLVNSQYETSEVLGAAYNQLCDLVDMINADSPYSMRMCDIVLRDNANVAKSLILRAVNALDSSLIAELNRVAIEREEKMAESCMHL